MAYKKFSSEFKAKVAIEALKGHNTTKGIASEFEVSPTQINQWNRLILNVRFNMFAVIYKFKLQEHQENVYKYHWHKIASYFIQNCGAIGSCLHKGADGLWVAYSRWPDRATRDASWPGEKAPNRTLPQEICDSIKQMQAIKEENSGMENDYDELCLDVVEDLLLVPAHSPLNC